MKNKRKKNLIFTTASKRRNSPWLESLTLSFIIIILFSTVISITINNFLLKKKSLLFCSAFMKTSVHLSKTIFFFVIFVTKWAGCTHKRNSEFYSCYTDLCCKTFRNPDRHQTKGNSNGTEKKLQCVQWETKSLVRFITVAVHNPAVKPCWGHHQRRVRLLLQSHHHHQTLVW